MTKKAYPHVDLLGIPFFSSSKAGLLATLVDQLDNSRKVSYIFTPNPEQVVQAWSEPRFLEVLQQADINLPDGQGIVWASRWQHLLRGTAVIKQRLTGVDMSLELLRLASTRQQPVLIVGGRGYDNFLANLTSYQIQTKVHWLPAYQDIRHPQPSEEQVLQLMIKKIRPAVVLVAFGAPWQEHWAVEHRQLLTESGVKVVMVVGGAFDYLLGKVRRAPQIIQQLGLEWLFRLVRQPWRWQRQLRLLKFVGLVIQDPSVKKSERSSSD